MVQPPLQRGGKEQGAIPGCFSDDNCRVAAFNTTSSHIFLKSIVASIFPATMAPGCFRVNIHYCDDEYHRRPTLPHNETKNMPLHGKNGLVVGIANADSVAYGCAKAFRQAGADLAVTYLNAKAEPYVRPLSEALGAALIVPLDVRVPGQLEDVFDRVRRQWGRLDFVLHSIAFAPRDDLHGRLIDSTADGFAKAMDVSCHSFVRMAKLAEPLMDNGGCLLTMSYYGAIKVSENYGLMGPVKAALESCVRYMAVEMGPKRIRVNAVSPGPMRTRAASGIKDFDVMMQRAATRVPEGRLATIDDVGALAAFLVSDGARAITGNTAYVDAGYHITS